MEIQPSSSADASVNAPSSLEPTQSLLAQLQAELSSLPQEQLQQLQASLNSGLSSLEQQPSSWSDWLHTKFTNTLNATKSWFKNSETILAARLEAASGVVLGALGATDWSALLSLDLQNVVKDTKTMVMAGGLFVHGLVLELLRRRNATDLS